MEGENKHLETYSLMGGFLRGGEKIRRGVEGKGIRGNGITKL